MIWRVPALMLIGSLSGAVGLWVADRDPPVLQNRERELLTPIVDPGGDLMIRFHVQRRKQCETRIERLLTDSAGVRYTLDAQEYISLPLSDGPESYTAKIPVPDDLHPGEAVYRAMATYTCNPIHRLFWPIRSGLTEVRFKVRSVQDLFLQPQKTPPQ